MPVKTDRKDARGIAQLMRLGWFRPVHCKSLPAQEFRALLTARKLLQTKNHDVEMCRGGAARLRAEGRQDDAAKFRRPHPRTGRRPATLRWLPRRCSRRVALFSSNGRSWRSACDPSHAKIAAPGC